MSEVYNIQNIQHSCDISTLNIPGGSAGAVVEIGGVRLVPSPFINANLEKYTVDDVVIGGVLKLQLSGIAVGNSFNEVAVSNNGRTSIADVLELSKNSDCVSVLIQCGDSEAFIDGKGKITSASASEGNSPTWVNVAPYTIDIDIFINKGQPVVNPESPSASTDPECDIKSLSLKEISEQFTLTIDEETYNWGVIDGANDGVSSVGRQHVKLDFSISARGNGSSGSCIDEENSLKLGLDAAESYIRCRIEKLKNMDLSGVSSPPGQEIVPTLAEFVGGPSFLDFRSVEVDPLKSLISVNGSIIYRKPSDSCDPVSQNVFTTVTVEESLDEEGAEVTISGTITGLVDVAYDKIIKDTNGFLNDSSCTYNTKMENANSFFSLFKIQDNLKAIAKAHKTADRIVDDEATGTGCNSEESSTSSILPSICADPCPTPSPDINDTCSFRLISSQVSKDYPEGQINFTFVLSNKSAASNIPGVSAVEIEGNHTMPRDTIVEQLVPGKGIVTQNLCAYSLEKWSFDISLRFTNQQRLCPTRSITQLRSCSEELIKNFFGCVQCPDSSCSNCADVEDPISGCWFVTDKSENISRSSYRYNIEFTKPSC